MSSDRNDGCAGCSRASVSLDAMQRGSLWEQHSAWWQQTFTEGADAEYEQQVLPLVEHRLSGAERVLDVGCGEGQVARRIARLGADVVGIDRSLSQVRAAHERGGPPRFVQARAEQLPCLTAAFDAVLVCLALEHIDPFEPAINEVAARAGTGWAVLVGADSPSPPSARKRLGRE